MTLNPTRNLKKATQADANYSNTLTRDCLLKRTLYPSRPSNGVSDSPVARSSEKMVGSFAFHRVAGVPLDRRPGSQKKNESLRWRLDGVLLHVSGYPDPLAFVSRSVFLYAIIPWPV